MPYAEVASGTILPAAPCPAPRYTGDATPIWSEEIRIDTPTPDWYGVRANATFTAGSTYTIALIIRATAGDPGQRLYQREAVRVARGAVQRRLDGRARARRHAAWVLV